MKKLQFSFILLLFAFSIFAQNSLYVVYNTNTFVSNSTSILISDKTKSIYEDGLIKADALEGNIGNNTFVLGGVNRTKIYKQIDDPHTVRIQIFKNKNSDSMIRKDYNILDQMPEMNWIINDEKPLVEINGYLCQEATVEFRGSKFMAYFTNEIPTTFGPWKFHGLSGLILEVKSLDNPDISWKVEKIVFPYKEKLVDESATISFDYSMKEYVDEIDNLINQSFKNYAAKTGANFQMAPVKERRNKLSERKYEWETW